MRSNRISYHFWAYCAALLACLSPVLAQAGDETGNPKERLAPTPVLQVLDNELNFMLGFFSVKQPRVAEQLRREVLELIRKSKAELSPLIEKYRTGKVVQKAILHQELSDLLKALRGLTEKLRGGLREEIELAEYSPDPSHCANHCERACGYNSLGEWICWVRCWRCCNNGGC